MQNQIKNKTLVSKIWDFIKNIGNKVKDFFCPQEIPHCGKPPKPSIIEKFIVFIYLLESKLNNFIYILFNFNKPKPRPAPGRFTKVAFVSVYGTSCGIATYNADLLNELKKLVDVKIFAEYKDNEKNTNLPADPDNIIRCWSRDEHPKKLLIKYIREYNPDIIHISHEYGFFAKAYYFTSLISTLKMYGYKIVSTMHSVYEHMDKTVSENCVPNLIVHSRSSKKCLVSKGIRSDIIYILPHGTNVLAGTNNNPELLDSLWNTWDSDHTIFQPGFLFDYKGHEKMLYIVARLKEKYPDIHYIVQGSENPFTMAEHDIIYRRLIEVAIELNILDNITINRGFISRDILLDYIRTVKCCVLPYRMHKDHNVRGTSGVARLILATTTPLVTSAVHLFDDLTDTDTAAICCDDEEIYLAINSIFDNDSIKQQQIIARKHFLRLTNWTTTSKKLYDIYQKIILG